MPHLLFDKTTEYRTSLKREEIDIKIKELIQATNSNKFNRETQNGFWLEIFRIPNFVSSRQKFKITVKGQFLEDNSALKLKYTINPIQRLLVSISFLLYLIFVVIMEVKYFQFSHFLKFHQLVLIVLPILSLAILFEIYEQQVKNYSNFISFYLSLEDKTENKIQSSHTF